MNKSTLLFLALLCAGCSSHNAGVVLQSLNSATRGATPVESAALFLLGLTNLDTTTLTMKGRTDD